MRRHPVVERLWDELDKTAQSQGFELVQATFGGPPGNRDLTIYVDRPGGITAEDCAAFAEQLSVLLDALDPIPGAYNLIVSSPGLDRPLGRDADFDKYVGQTATVRYLTEAGKTRRVRGRLAGTREGSVLLEMEASVQELPLAQVSAANLEYDWEGAGGEETAA